VRPGRRALLVGEHGDEAAVAGIEVQVALGRVVEVGLLEDEGHPEHALPEVDRGPAVGPDDRDVVDALALELAHRQTCSARASRSAPLLPMPLKRAVTTTVSP
jgi:hypothetical protein